jgi:glucose-1-phosphate cytidylyltransferase
MEELPVVILAGGLGLRMRSHNYVLPKALVPVGGSPIIEHVIKIYAHFGMRRFLICTGYRGGMIKKYCNERFKGPNNVEGLNVTCIDTGLKTQTGGRIKKIERHINTGNFFLTYCDGIADIDIKKLYELHVKKGKIATLTVVHPMSPFGVVEVKGDRVSTFKEKPVLPGYINGGFFVFGKKIFDYLDENCVLEEEPLKMLAKEGQLMAYKHLKFWACMDTHKDAERLNILWNTGTFPNADFKAREPPWKVW